MDESSVQSRWRARWTGFIRRLRGAAPADSTGAESLREAVKGTNGGSMSYLSEADAKEFLADALSPARREHFAAPTRAVVVDVPDSVQERLDLFFELSELAIDLEIAGAKAASASAVAPGGSTRDRDAHEGTTPNRKVRTRSSRR